jgi:excisionase family DNA binding protein
MTKRPFFTTFEISQICGVNPTTVQNWIKSKKLRAFRTPGGHRRVRREELIQFLKEFGMPLPPELAAEKLRIMVVDDERDVADLLEALMRSGSGDVDVVKVQNGIEALLMIGESRPDLLILDIRMPGMNGYEVCRKLKTSAKTRSIKIVAISGDHDPDVRERILKAGADLFYTKPLDIAAFRESCFRLVNMGT